MKFTDLNNKFSKKEYIDSEFKEVEKKCRNNHIPLTDRDAADFLKLQLKLTAPKKILEIGSAHGFSTLLLAKNSAKDAEITTIEFDINRAMQAKQNFEKYNYNRKIDLKVGDAFDVLMYLESNYDFIFLDAAKGQYFYLFEYIWEILAPGGLLIADNVLYKGKVLKNKKVRHKIRTMVNNLKKYLNLIMNHPKLDSTIISAGDGMALSRRKYKNE